MRIAIREWFRSRFGVQEKRRSNRSRLKQTAACLTVGLATAWGGSADAALVKVAITPEESLTNVGVVFFFGNTSSTPLIRYLGDAPDGTTSIFILDFAQSEEAFEDGSFPAGYYFAATYDNAGEPSVALGFSDRRAIVAGLEYEQFLGPDKSLLVQNLIDQDLNPRSPYFVPFGNPYRDDFPYPDYVPEFGTDATIVNFSQASFGGTINISLVPEPGSLMLLISTAGITTLSRRRRD